LRPKAWRPSHIHYLIAAPGYKPLVTQLFFKGDPHNKTDDFIKESLIIELTQRKVPRADVMGYSLGGRITALLAGTDNIREVIAFPKTQSGSDPMTHSPTPVDPKQLAELGLRALPPPA
jgi:hypothetical protein